MTKTKKEKIVDLKPKAEKINDEELQGLQAAVRTIDRLTIDVGRIEIQKYTIIAAMQNAQESMETIRQDFLAKYGTDNINIQTGEIAYAPETPEQTTPQENGEVNS